MDLGQMLTRSGHTHLEVSLMVSPGFFCLLVCSFILSSVICYEEFCLYVATNFFCIPVIRPKLGKHLVTVQYLGLFYSMSKRILLFFSYIFHLCCCYYSCVSSFNGIRSNDRVYPVLTNEEMTTESQWYNCFIRNGGNAIPKHACPEAKGSNPTTGLLLLWARNPFGGNSN